MDFIFPYPTVRPSSPVKAKLQPKYSKLSLKNRLKTADSLKENNSQALQSKNKLPTNITKDLHEILISSDESDHEEKVLSDSTFLQGSQFCIPQAESTRLEFHVGHSKEETKQDDFFSCRSRLTTSFDDLDEPEGACEESIIYVSDNDSMPLPKRNGNPNVIIPESTDSGSSDEKTKQKQQSIKDTHRTIFLDSSSEDESVFIRKHLVAKTVLSTLNGLSKNKRDQWSNIIIPTSSSGSDESNDIVDSSLQAPAQKKNRNLHTPTSSESSIKKKSHQPNSRRAKSKTSEEENSLEEPQEISPRALAAEKLTQTKVNYIQRWIDGSGAASFESTETDPKDGISSTTSTKSPQKEEENGELSSDDSIDALKLRNRKPPKKTPAVSSFIADDSSCSSGDSYSNYHKVLTNDIKKDINAIEKTPFGILSAKQTPLVPRPHNLMSDLCSDSSQDLSDGESSSSSDWDFNRDKKRVGKTVKKAIHDKHEKPKPKLPILDNRKEDTRKPGKKRINDTPRTLKKPVGDTPRTLKKPVGDTPRTWKKPVDDTPRTWKKPVDDTPKILKKPVGDTRRTQKNTTEDKLKTPKPRKKNGKVEDLKKATTPYSPIRTFLTSLSGPAKNPELRNHPEASIYFKNFKSKKKELARRLYKLYNREVFDCRLPDDMVIEWSDRMYTTAGVCQCKLIRRPEGTTRTASIFLSTKVLDSAERLRDTLIHELCHAAVWMLNNVSGGHGPFWKAWAAKAEKRFPELPKIEKCHDYEIETKFIYRCVNCGYSFGRHSKSIDLATQRCGKCYGKFELLVNKKNRRGGPAVATPATPKAPTGFALFVKENYGSVKSEHAGKKHGDIMKLLGQKFAEAKIGQ